MDDFFSMFEMVDFMMLSDDPSPVALKNSLLIKMRLTGNHFSVIDGKIAWRDIEANVEPRFFIGLPIVAPHPQDAEGNFVDLDSSNFNQYVVGIVLSCEIQNGKVMGIGRIYNNRAINALLEKKISTSSREKVLLSEVGGIYIETLLNLDSVALVDEGFVDFYDKSKGVMYGDTQNKKDDVANLVNDEVSEVDTKIKKEEVNYLNQVIDALQKTVDDLKI